MSEAVSYEVEVYQTEEGRSPFSEWIRNLKDRLLGPAFALDWRGCDWVTSVTPTLSVVASTSSALTTVPATVSILVGQVIALCCCFVAALKEPNHGILNRRGLTGATTEEGHREQSISPV